MTEDRPYVPVIIIGAGRSGTKMLRDALAQLPGAGTWPCDEINYIWRHGNAAHPDDELEPAMARPGVQRFVRRAFRRLSRRRQLAYVVEKTCANSLRVGFVHHIFPEARFVFLVRDGRDVTASAMQRWNAPLDIPYLARKARYVPWRDLPYYAVRYLWNRLYRLTSKRSRLSSWGPRFQGMKKAAQTLDLASLCALQWVRCVDKADADLREVPPEQVYRMRYEDFVQNPAEGLGELTEFLGIQVDPQSLQRSVAHVSPASIGRSRSRLDDAQLEAIAPVLEATLRRHGYPVGEAGKENGPSGNAARAD